MSTEEQSLASVGVMGVVGLKKAHVAQMTDLFFFSGRVGMFIVIFALRVPFR